MQITKSYNSLCIKHEWKETSSYKSIQFHRKRPSQAPHVVCVLSLHSSVVWARLKRELLLLAVFCDWPCRVTPYFHVRCEQTNCMWAESLLLESNRWLNITIGLFRDESGFVLLHCGEQTLMEVILTNIKLIPDTLAHQHQLFVCHCGEHCARLMRMRIVFVCMYLSLQVNSPIIFMSHLDLTSYLQTHRTQREGIPSAYEKPPHLSFLSMFRQSPCRCLKMYCLLKCIPSGLASVGLWYYCATTVHRIINNEAQKDPMLYSVSEQKLMLIVINVELKRNQKQTDLLTRLSY